MEMLLDLALVRSERSTRDSEMASAFSTALGPIEATVEFSASKMNAFAMFDMRGFGGFGHPMGIAVYSDVQ